MIYTENLETSALNNPIQKNTEKLYLLNDEELMARFQNQCEASFSLLMERYQNPIYSFIFRFVGEKESAEDLTQEVFLRVYQRGATFRLDAKFSTWLYRIARNISIDFCKRRRQSPKLILNQTTLPNSDDLSLAEQVPGGEPNAEQHYLNLELGQHIQGAIQKLPPKYREVFLLCSVKGFSYEEAGKILKCPVKTISSRLCRAKVKFLKAIEKYVNIDEQNRFVS